MTQLKIHTDIYAILFYIHSLFQQITKQMKNLMHHHHHIEVGKFNTNFFLFRIFGDIPIFMMVSMFNNT